MIRAALMGLVCGGLSITALPVIVSRLIQLAAV